MSHKRVGYIALFSCTAVLSLVAAFGAITSLAFTEKVLPRTLVAGVDISNLRYPQAEQKINERASQLTNLRISFSLKDQSANTDLNTLGVNIDQRSALSQVIRPHDSFDWLRLGYWRAMFSPKAVAFSFDNEPSKTRKAVESILGITTAAQDASIGFENGRLVVREGQKGVSVSDAAIQNAITTVLATGAAAQASLTFTESEPIITTTIATQTKTEIEQTIIPIHLSFADQNFIIDPDSIYSFLDFGQENGKITWQVSNTKVKDYLNSTIAAKLNIKMLPKTTKYDTQEVTQEGRDGRQVNTSKLSAEVARTITERADTTNSPITISTSTIPFTEKILYPNYIANLFPGLYADVNISTQQMFILNGPTLMATYLISSGKPGLPTPSGLFYVCNKIVIARSPLYSSLWMPKWNALSTSPDSCGGYRGYGVHGLPCFNSSCTLVESAAHLGRPVSHGCIRLPDDGAAWFFDNMPTGTPVNIHR